MYFMAVDDEAHALRDLTQALGQAAPEASLASFARAAEALEHARSTPVDVAFLDVQLGEMDGISLALRLKEINPRTNIVFVTGYSDYMGNAFSIHASGYLVKPVRVGDIVAELDNLRHPVTLAAQPRVRVKCFGSFDVFVDDRLMLFTRSKPKELLAYLINQHGSAVKTAKIASVLWEDKVYDRSLQKQTQTVISQLMKTLREYDAEGIVLRGWNNMAVDVGKIHCDYYEFLRGNVAVLNTYLGEYMADYSWAELTTGLLTEAKQGRMRATDAE